jgi:uncharacterized protein (DUF2126 family)
VQVRARGLTGDRFVIACNGRSLPLAPTGTFGEAVVGVRYRRGPPSALIRYSAARSAQLRPDRHLVGPLHRRLPLSVSHPGGRNYEIFPINAYEAEGRRLARFEANGHTAGPMVPAQTASTRVSCHSISAGAPLRHQRKPRAAHFPARSAAVGSTGMIDVGVHSRERRALVCGGYSALHLRLRRR